MSLQTSPAPAPARLVGMTTRINSRVRQELKIQAARESALIEDALHRALCRGLGIESPDVIEQTPLVLREAQGTPG